MCLDQANSGTKLLLLDLRKREEIEVPPLQRVTAVPARDATGQTVFPDNEEQQRQDYLDAALEQMTALRQDLKELKLCESLDACAVAYAHRFLFGSMDPTERAVEQRMAVPLHEAIRKARLERRTHDEDHDEEAAATDERLGFASALPRLAFT